MTKFFAAGTPRPQGSKRQMRGRFVEDSKHLKAWRQTVVDAARRAHNSQPPLDGPLCCRVRFLFPCSKTKPEKAGMLHTVTLDVDKLQRAVGDALTIAGVIVDDKLIAVWSAEKRYTAVGETPGVYTEITKILGEAP